MIRISKMTDYGIVLLTHFAAQSSQSVFTARDLAAESDVPLPTVSKLLKSLSRAKLLSSLRGINGGYQLTRPSHEISIAEIITALEGPIAITECSGKMQGLCELEHTCPVRSNWRKISGVVYSALSNLTLADMAKPLPRTTAEIGQMTAGRMR